MEALIILAVALTLDILLGDPPTAIHPVGWMGRLIALLERAAPTRGTNLRKFYGIAMVLIGTCIVTVPVVFLVMYLDDMNRIAYLTIGALILKSTFAIRGLSVHARRIRKFLANGEPERAREQMNTLVSRPAEELTESQLVAATVESVAENTSDSFVAPLFYFLLFGIPGAVAYRMVNTFDSMIGYRGKYEHLGKFAARLDDLLNFIPARLTALMMVGAAFLTGHNSSRTWRIMLRDHARTESPNAGWPMSAAAGALGIELEKVGCYRLGDGDSALTWQKIDSSLSIMYVVALMWVSFCTMVRGVILIAA